MYWISEWRGASIVQSTMSKLWPYASAAEAAAWWVNGEKMSFSFGNSNQPASFIAEHKLE